MSNVIQFPKHRKPDNTAYCDRIAHMDKLDLLEEMVRFQQERAETGHLTPELMLNGIVLFGALEQASETPELKLLTRSYRRHLEYEAESYFGY